MVHAQQVSLYRFALNFLGSSEDAKDIVQDVFEKLWLNVDRIDHDKVKSWLFTCTHHAMLNFIKRRARIDYMQSIHLQGNAQVDSFEFESKINAIVGKNGIGKTTILDAIYHLAVGKCYFNPLSTQNIKHGEEFFVIDAELEKENRAEQIVCSLKKGQKKILTPEFFF